MGVKVKELLKQKTLALKCVDGENGLANECSVGSIQKPGLLLTGLLDELIHPERVQILGAAETGYLENLAPAALKSALEMFLKPGIPAVVVTRGLIPPRALVKFSRKRNIPVLTTPLTSSVFIERIIKFLDEKLAPSIMLHGVLVDVLGMGILITGKSGIGKSECALDLISRGYRLVADDAVVVKRVYPSTLFGTATDSIPYHIEVRGIGIVNIKDLFGITAIREKKQMDLAVELVSWDPKGEYERLGFEEKTVEILGVELPHLTIPVSPGRSMATIVEVAARNQILKIMGHHPGVELMEKLAFPQKGAIKPKAVGKAKD